MDKYRYMRVALDLAREAEKQGEIPVGAVLVKNNTIIGKGFNCPIGTKDPSAHAEIRALRNAGGALQNYRLTETALFTTLEPCIMCFSALIHARISRLVYGAPDPKGGIFSTGVFEKIKMVYNHSLEIESGIMQAECSNILKAFFEKRRDAGAVERDGLENR